MPAFQDLTGQKFSRLTVVKRAPNKGSQTQWFCQCECGICKSVARSALLGGLTKSCGCLNAEAMQTRGTHRMSSTPEYKVWKTMNQRCGNPQTPGFAKYGAKGIKVCKRWSFSFENFIADMGLRPSPKHSLERKNNAKGYTPANCCWATATTQARNRGPAKTKSLKIVGVYFNKGMGKFQAAITVAGKQIHLGTFAKVKDAVAARRAAENRHWSATSIS